MSTENIGNVRLIDIDEEMRGAYLDYAMSVIVSRALPDVRDGLKPVHRRILYAMHSMGLRHDRPHRKSARIVGEVLGKFHPHSDDAVYDAMVRLAQDFSMRYPLVDGQGNFGSIDGDNAAAMRYTEARLAQIAAIMLGDIEKETVDFTANFDETLNEPAVLPSALPNFLVNGASGIAVGMATNIPPHNLSEIVDALVFMIEHYHAVDEITLEHLMYFVKGPDFPTGGIIYRYREGRDGHEDIIAKAFAGGKGRLLVQAKVHVEAMSRNRNRLVVTELPYQTNKTRLIERIAEMVRDGKMEGITDLRDESDRQGMRIVIELTRNVEPKDILEQLYKYTPMQATFGVNMLGLVDGEPRLLSLKRALHLFIEHRREIVRRRSEYDLARAKERAHILEGLLTALANLDDVIATIRRSPDTNTARQRLMKKFKLSEIQAQAILDMPLKRLSRLEREKLETEYKELVAQIRYLEDLLANPQKMLGVIKEELLALKEEYGDDRRTQIVDVQGVALTASEFLPDEDVLVMLTKKGQFFRQSLAGRRRGSLPRRLADAPIALAAAPARDSVFIFTAAGQAVQKRIHQIPNEEGSHFAELTELEGEDEVVSMLALAQPEEEEAEGGDTLFLYTREGRCKRIALSELWSAAHNSPLVINVEEGDALAGVVLCDSEDDLLLITRLGQSIRFSQEEVRVMGLSAAGVLAMKLSDGDQIAGAGLCKPEHEAVFLTTQGYGLRVKVDRFPVQKRYGSGVVGMRLSKNHGAVETMAVVDEEPEMFVVQRTGPMRIFRLDDAPAANRGTRGRQIPALSDGDVELLLALVIPKVKEDSDSIPEPPPPPPPPPAPKRRRASTRKTANAAGSKSTSSSASSRKSTSQGAEAAAEKEASTGRRTSSRKVVSAAGSTSTGESAEAAAEKEASIAGEKPARRRTSSARAGQKAGAASTAEKKTATPRRTSTRKSAAAGEAAAEKKTSTRRRRAPAASSKSASTKTEAVAEKKTSTRRRTSTRKTTPSPSTTSATPSSLESIKRQVRKQASDS